MLDRHSPAADLQLPSGDRQPSLAISERLWLILAIGFIAITMALGGSPRPEVASLPVLRGIAALAIVLVLAGMTRLGQHYSPLLPIFAGIGLLALPTLHLLPLPPGISASLSGRGLLAEIDEAAGLGPVWRPLSLSPLASANALLAGLVPLAALLLALMVPPAKQRHLVSGILAAGAIGMVIALTQMLAPAESGLYFFETTNPGSPVGLFANRNHQAVFLACLIVLLPIALPCSPPTAAGVRVRGHAMLRTGMLILACLSVGTMALLTGSRAGAVTASLAILAVPVIRLAQGRVFRADPVHHVRRGTALLGGIFALCLLAIVPIAVWMDRAPALDRLFAKDPEREGRLLIMPQVIDLVGHYWPWGSGVGSFEKVFQLHEPQDLLGPSYMNHAHNDLLEILLTTGLAGLALMSGAIGLWIFAAVRTFILAGPDSHQPLRQAGLIVLLLLFLASLTDYPLRTPALSALFALATVWAAMPGRPHPLTSPS